jgi:hypothetical protein
MLFAQHQTYSSILLEREAEAVGRVKEGIGRNTGRPVKRGKDMVADYVQREIV